MSILQFGDSQKLQLVRILRSTVMVRVGGGWCTLDEFLIKNDPCRGNYTHLVLNGTRVKCLNQRFGYCRLEIHDYGLHFL